MTILAGQIIRAADLVPEEWQPVDFRDPVNGELTGWRNYGNGFSDAQFRRHPLDGTVEIKGTVTGGPTGTTDLIFRLPEGYYPASHVGFVVGDITVTSTTAKATCAIRIHSDGGGVRIYGGSGLTTLALDGIRFFSGWD